MLINQNTTTQNMMMDVIKNGTHNTITNTNSHNKTFNLIGWQTKDIYQNVNVTYLSSVQVNQRVDKNLFKLPAQN